jgi:hypothetical protein
MEKVVLLNDEERRHLLNFLAKQNSIIQPNGEEVKANEPDTFRVREREWLRKHRAEYAGQWIALDGDKLLSHGFDGRKVYDEAEQKCDVPFVVHLEAEDKPPFGGW